MLEADKVLGFFQSIVSNQVGQRVSDRHKPGVAINQMGRHPWILT